jgi:hypothetical protein
METVEPVKFSVEGRGFDIDENYTPRLTGFHSDWDDTHDFLFNNIIGDYFEEFSMRTMSERYMEVLREEVEPIQDISPTLVDIVSPTDDYISPSRPSSVLYLGEESVIVPNQSAEGIFYMISNNKNRCRSTRDDIIDDFESAVDNYVGLGLKDVNVHYGDEFSKNVLLEKENVSSVDIGECNDFEQSVYEELEPVSEAFIHNTTVNFGGYDANPECDIILPLSPTTILHIEVKDYSGNDNEPSEDDIIDRPLKRAELLDANLTVTIVKGVDPEKLGNFKSSAELRDSIEIIEKPDTVDIVTDYLEETIPRNSISHLGWKMM